VRPKSAQRPSPKIAIAPKENATTKAYATSARPNSEAEGRKPGRCRGAYVQAKIGALTVRATGMVRGRGAWRVFGGWRASW
jgi:hypothetical protein